METNPFRAARTEGASGDGDAVRPARRPTGKDAAPGAGRPGPVESARAWLADAVAGRRWEVRAPLLLLLGWLFHAHLTRPDFLSIFHGINLGFHEMGHATFMWSGHRLLTAAGGTLAEVSVPLAAALYLLVRQRDPFGATVALFWWGDALKGVGRYVADARAQALPLVSPFGVVDPGSHDWTTILMRFGALSRDQAIGGSVQGAGLAVMGAALLAGAGVLWAMARWDVTASRRSDRRS